MSYRYEVESDTPLVLFLGIANRPTIVPTTYEAMHHGEELELADKDWGHKLKLRRVA